MTRPELIIERAALQIFGMQSPISQLHVVLRGLGLTPAEAAQIFTATLDRARQLEHGLFLDRVTLALEDGEPEGRRVA